MASSLNTANSRRRGGVLAKWRRLWQIINDLEQIVREFDDRQRRLEEAQRSTDRMLTEASARLDALLQRPDLATETRISMLNIKNLGYDLGRQLAEKHLSGRTVAVDHACLKSKLCTQNDFAADWLHYWCHELHCAPIYHRKIWELCYVSQALFAEGLLAPGRRGIGFGCGEEPLPSLFAKYGAIIAATDLDGSRSEAQAWRLTGEHAGAIETIRRRDICPDPALIANIEFHPVDMNAIPREYDGVFDFCWSTCALEHLGTIENGLAFIENSMRTLKPGGLAVHTTEFTFSEGETIDNNPTVLYQRHHLEALAARLHAAGDQAAEFDFSHGDGILDRFVDLPPYRDNELIPPQAHAHLRLLVDGHTCTSVGIIIKG